MLSQEQYEEISLPAVTENNILGDGLKKKSWNDWFDQLRGRK